MAINLIRSPRNDLLVARHGCSVDVGPGTYPAAPSGVRISEPQQHGVPFQSLQDKIPTNRSTSAMTPGPGAYQLAQQAEERLFACTAAAFKSRSARIAPITPGSSEFNHSTIIANPGPGTYKGHQRWIHPKPKQHEKGQPVLEICKTASSIPQIRTKLVNENEESQDNKGKEELEFDPQEVRRTRSTNFHVSVSSRKLWEPSCAIENALPSKMNPGPGTYLDRRRVDSAPVRGSRSVFISKTPMCHQRTFEEPSEMPPDSDITKPLGEGCPAAVNTFVSPVQRIGCSRRDLNQPFKDPYCVRAVPGPGFYHKEEEEGLEPAKKKFHGVHHPNIRSALNEATGPFHAFNTTDIRPCNKKPSGQGNPSPGEYSIDQVLGASMIADIQEKALVGKKGVFGTTSDRFYRCHFDDWKQKFADTNCVDVRNYNPIITERDDKAKTSNMFRSGTQRFTDDDPDPKNGRPSKHQDPGPLHYYPEKDINYRSPFRHAHVGHLSFGSGRNRFSKSGVFNGKEQKPGPGEYNACKRTKPKGAAKCKARRLGKATLGSTTDSVGPGTYELERSMLKKSFNVTT